MTVFVTAMRPLQALGLRAIALLSVGLTALSACGGANVIVQSEFPVPLVRAYPLNMGWYLDDTLTHYTHKESLGKEGGDFAINIGDAQHQMFDNLARGLFASHEFVDGVKGDDSLHGVLQPTIEELQFSTPKQTRSDYYEVWIRYQFKLFAADGSLRGTWPMTAYGKANTQNYGMSSTGRALEEAALAACRDAMAYFSLHFHSVPVVKDWLTEQDVRLDP